MTQSATNTRFQMAATLILAPLAAFSARGALAAGGAAPKTIDYFSMITQGLGIGSEWTASVGAVFVFAIVALLGVRFKSALASGDLVPPERFGVQTFCEMVMDVAYGIAKDNCGSGYKKFLPFLAGLLIFILVSNLTGLIPGFPPTTANMSTNVGMGAICFLVYNFAGFKEHGVGYIKQFLGPVVWIAPLFFCIELVSHFARPLSLGLRLMGNLFADHLLVGVFTNLTYFVFPSILMFFGLMVACVQSYIFTLLTGIYISMAVSHDH